MKKSKHLFKHRDVLTCYNKVAAQMFVRGCNNLSSWEHKASLCFVASCSRFIYPTPSELFFFLMWPNKLFHHKSWQRGAADTYLRLTETSAQAVAGVLLVLQPLQIPLQALFGHFHALKMVCGLSTGLWRLEKKRTSLMSLYRPF